MSTPFHTAEHSPLPENLDTVPANTAHPSGYVVESILGRGGMGIVYRALDTKLNRPVALKMLLMGERSADNQLQRFRIEAEAIASLRHPNILQIYGVDQWGDQPFFALELVTAGSLSQFLNGHPLPSDHSARLVCILARAVHAVHEAGIIHRDLKPGNILLQHHTPGVSDDFVCLLRGERLIPKIADFGLARLVERDYAQTRTGEILGTPAYMAPEQAGGGSKNVTPLADVFSLGAILYELLTGRAPFVAATPLETVLKVLKEPPPSPRLFAPNLEGDLEIICLKCLSKTPANRYASARALAEDLGRFLAGEPIQARPIEPLEELARLRQERPFVAYVLFFFEVLWLLLTGVLASKGSEFYAGATGCLSLLAALLWLSWPNRRTMGIYAAVGIGSIAIAYFASIQLVSSFTGIGVGTFIGASLAAPWWFIPPRWRPRFTEWLSGSLLGSAISAVLVVFLLFSQGIEQTWTFGLMVLGATASGAFFGGAAMAGVIRWLDRRSINDQRNRPSRSTTIDHSEAFPESATADHHSIDHVDSCGQRTAAYPSTSNREIGSDSPSIPGYIVEEQLGEGGMGTVYRARHVSTNRVVALKVIRSDRGNDSASRERFLRETRTLARLKHPHIIEIYEMGKCGDQLFFASEFMAEGSLAQKVKRQRVVENAEAAKIIEVLARAIHVAHREGIVHRDLKPQNVLLASDGSYKIADFGLATVDDESTLTHTGDILGTPAYMSPEQAAGRNREVGPAADIYALGAMLYLLVTGQTPFRAESRLALLEQIQKQLPVPPRRLRPQCPRDLDSICLRCLEKSPDRRYASAAALADDLARFQSGRPISIRPNSLWSLLRSQKNSKISLTATAIVVVAGGATGFLRESHFVLAVAIFVSGIILAIVTSNFLAARRREKSWEPEPANDLFLSQPLPWNDAAPDRPVEQNRKGWITLPLGRMRFPAVCCACGKATNSVMRLNVESGSRQFELGVPYCEDCQASRRLRRRRWTIAGIVIGCVASMILAELYGRTNGLQGYYSLFMDVWGAVWGSLFGAIAGRVCADRPPVRVRRYSWQNATVELWFRNELYAKQVMMATSRMDDSDTSDT